MDEETEQAGCIGSTSRHNVHCTDGPRVEQGVRITVHILLWRNLEMRSALADNIIPIEIKLPLRLSSVHRLATRLP
jgi:hypothetical protein